MPKELAKHHKDAATHHENAAKHTTKQQNITRKVTTKKVPIMHR